MTSSVTWSKWFECFSSFLEYLFCHKLASFCCFSQQFFTLYCLWVIIIPFSKQNQTKTEPLRCSALIRNSTFERGLTWHMFQLSGSRLLLSCCHLFSRAIRVSLCKSILLIGLCLDFRISCNSWFYFLFDTICMSLDMICISKRAINFHPSISLKANGITSHDSAQPRTVTSSHKYAAPKKDEKANPFLLNYLKVLTRSFI